MNSIIKLSTLISMTALISACGGGGGGGSSTTSSPAQATEATTEDALETPQKTVEALQIEGTQDIVAARDFDFSVGETITLTVQYSSESDGAIHIYSDVAHTFEDGSVAPDPMSRITTLFASESQTVDLEVNGNWDTLYLNWVPNLASESEQVEVVTLNQTSHSYLVQF